MSQDTIIQEAVALATAFVNHDETARFELVCRLRSEKRLCSTVRGLNVLLNDPIHGDLGLRALRSIGLDCAE